MNIVALTFLIAGIGGFIDARISWIAFLVAGILMLVGVA
jgi:hypothetical protein